MDHDRLLEHFFVLNLLLLCVIIKIHEESLCLDKRSKFEDISGLGGIEMSIFHTFCYISKKI